MLSELEVAQYKVFGFVVLSNFLKDDEVAGIEQAYERVMAKSLSHDYFGNAGTRVTRDVENQDPTFASFVVHPHLIEAMKDIWGLPCLYFSSDVWLNRDDTPWHTDGMPGRSQISEVKVTLYLDEMTAQQGSLNLISGSHHPQVSESLFTECGCWDSGRPRLRFERDKIPGAISLHTRPHDVVVWDTRLWHSAWKRQDGRPRRSLFFSFYPDPHDHLLKVNALREECERKCQNRGEPMYGRNFLSHDDAHIQWMADRLEAIGVKHVRA